MTSNKLTPPTLPLFAVALAAEIVVQVFTVRVHSNVAREPWARLWYLCRAFDVAGTGHIELPVELAKQLLGVSHSTIYRWLGEGKAAAAYRQGRIKDGILSVWLGSLNNVCRALGVKDFGIVGEVPLGKLTGSSGVSPPE